MRLSTLKESIMQKAASNPERRAVWFEIETNATYKELISRQSAYLISWHPIKSRKKVCGYTYG
jgi:hypothetical protein